MWTEIGKILLLVTLAHGLGRSKKDRELYQIIEAYYELDLSNEIVEDDRAIVKPQDDQFSLPVPDMIHSYDYVCETHTYVTEDGYINVLHRIPPSKGAKDKKQVVFVQHGLLGTSADFVMGRPDKSLGYILADQGYDVWMGNARGNIYSRNHTKLTVDDDAYWAFSFDEMGKYDIPAALAYVLKNQPKDYSPKVFYIGHSMGTTMFWVAMNEHQKFMEDSVHMMVAMGPVAYVGNVESPITLFSPFLHQIETLFKWLGIREFRPSNAITRWFEKMVCDQTMVQLKVCENYLFLITGYDSYQMNMTLLPIILGHEPGGASTKTLIHFAQLTESDNFAKYDHGLKDNLKYYNQTTPPEYDMSKVTVPVMLIWAHNDWLADPKDVARIKLPHLVESHEIMFLQFNHVDFLWAKDAPEMVYTHILHQLNNFKP